MKPNGISPSSTRRADASTKATPSSSDLSRWQQAHSETARPSTRRSTPVAELVPPPELPMPDLSFSSDGGIQIFEQAAPERTEPNQTPPDESGGVSGGD